MNNGDTPTDKQPITEMFFYREEYIDLSKKRNRKKLLPLPTFTDRLTKAFYKTMKYLQIVFK